MTVSKEVSNYMKKISKKGAKARKKNYWADKSKEERTKIMSERRLKGIAKSQFLISKDADNLEEDYLDNKSYRGGKLIKE